jgi:hypothetical protein
MARVFAFAGMPIPNNPTRSNITTALSLPKNASIKDIMKNFAAVIDNHDGGM